MEGFEKGLSVSESTARPKFSSTGFEENNENDSSQDKMIPKFQNHKKTVSKNFMSSKISAASKAAASRKKILAERNENSRICDAQNHKNSDPDWKNCRRNHSDRSPSRIVSPYNHASEPEDDSSVKAYDPLTNYLSPRPKYLRFNPNRRLEIFNRLEREGREELNSSFESLEVNDEVESSSEETEDSSFSPPKESVLKPKNREETEEYDNNIVDCYEDEQEEEVEEEFEEERGWCLRGVLKLLLTLIACVFSTSYICSMNSPTSLPTQQAISNLKVGCLMIKNHTLEFVSMKMHDAGFFEVELGDNYSEVEEVGIDGDDHEEIEESFEAEIVEDDVENMERHEKVLVRMENEDNKDNINQATEFDGESAAEFESEVNYFEQSIAAKNDETIDASSFCLEEEVESSKMGFNEENVDNFQAAETEIIGSGEVEPETQSSEQLIGAKTDESEDAGGYVVLEREREGSNPKWPLELSVKSISEETPKEHKGVDDVESLEGIVGSHTDSVNEVDETGDDNEVEMEKAGWNNSAVVGVPLVSTLLTSLAIIYRLKKARSKSAEESKPVLKPHKLAVGEKVTPMLPSIERKVEFFARPSLSSHLIGEAPKEHNHHIHAPTVELIGEIVIGQVSSPRSSRKHQMTESEEGDAAFSEKLASLPQPISSPTKPSATEHSSSSSLSYGSFTTETKILKKKEGVRSREAMTEVTPVRRSSRLRNRAADNSL